jgi:hypothetical protein
MCAYLWASRTAHNAGYVRGLEEGELVVSSLFFGCGEAIRFFRVTLLACWDLYKDGWVLSVVE